MADYTKTYTLDFTQLGDTVYEACDKLEDNIDSIVGWINDLKDNYASATAPSTPAASEGQLWWDSTNDILKVYDGSTWKSLIGDAALYLYDSNASNVLTLSWGEDDTSDRTLGLLVGGGNRTLTLNENFVIGDGNAGTLTYSAASKTLTVEGTSVVSQDYSTDGTPTFGTVYLYDAGGESITSDGTDLTINSGALIELTATSDVVIPVNIGLIFGDGAENIESDNTDLTISSGGDIDLTATSDVNIPANVGVTFGDDGEKIEGDGTDLTISASADMNLTATADINVPASVGVTFGDDGEKIEGDGTDLTIASSAKLNLTATSDVIVPVNVGVILGDGAEKLESDNTDLTVNSGGDINLTATSDINVPASVGMTFGNDGEKIEGDGTDLTIASSGIMNLSATNGILLAENTALYWDASLSADGKYAGVVEDGTAGAALSFGQCIYQAVADDRWELAKGDAEATTAHRMGFCVLAAAGDGSATKVLFFGVLRADAVFPTFTKYAPVYLSAATGGAVTNTAPTGSGNQIRRVGSGRTGDELDVCISPTWLEHV